ncbi:MAG: hypothetical protein AUJ72_03685 [Candidatus Omnitrophica bacterium CG1_02_46_14]|nr:MAG: hypothetical protein AUJ72_03685 [Candidatus Omnitrophica bacterium CG1_02_46_14]
MAYSFKKRAAQAGIYQEGPIFMTIPLQTKIIYGPLESRRLGRSLGVNLLPSIQKLCTFDCLYCQYGDTRKLGVAKFPSLKQIEEETDAAFSYVKAKSIKIDWITFSGNGEPTIYPDFPSVVEILLCLRDKYLYEIPIGILSNSSTCHRPEIRQSLMKLDGRFMKLDAGLSKTYQALNKPTDPRSWDPMIQGLQSLHRIVLQSLFVTGRIDNTSDKEIDQWIKLIKTIKPEGVQVYTIQRKPEHTDVLPVSQEKLRAITTRVLDETHISAFIYD